MPTSAAAAMALAQIARLVSIGLIQTPGSPRSLVGEPMLQQEEVGWPEAEHHERVAVEAVSYSAPAWQPQVLAHGQGRDVAHAAPVQVGRCGMMNGVGASPVVVGGQRQHPDHPPDPVVRAAPAEERAVTTVVLDHEYADKEAGRRHGQKQGKPVAEPEACPGEQPEAGE